MDNDKIKIAITQGDINGTGFEMIMKTFAEPEMMDICIPIIYGSRKAAIFHAKTLGLQCQFNFIDKAEDAVDGKVNVVKCPEDNSRVEFGASTETSVVSAIESLEKAVNDICAKKFDALVCAPMKREAFNTEKASFTGDVKYISSIMESEASAFEVYVGRSSKTMFMDADSKDAADSNAIAGRIRTLHKSLSRDFRISNPRIAVLTDTIDDRKEIITTALSSLTNEGIQAFGPYCAKDFTDSNDSCAFAGILSISSMTPEEDSAVLLSGIPEVCVIMNSDPHCDIAGKGLADESLMRKAIYQAIDTCRFRKEHDEPTANPLQKLYRERPDSGEKMRFAIPKRKEDNGQQQTAGH